MKPKRNWDPQMRMKNIITPDFEGSYNIISEEINRRFDYVWRQNHIERKLEDISLWELVNIRNNLAKIADGAKEEDLEW